MSIKFKITDSTIAQLNEHLFPDDGKEAVAFVLCGHVIDDTYTILLAHKVIPLSYDSCLVRKHDYVQWLTQDFVPILNEAEKNNLAIVKVHSHPKGYSQFSDVDNESDKELYPSIYSWSESDLPSLSAILLPNNELIVRHVSDSGIFTPVSVTIIGDEVHNTPVEFSLPREVSDFEVRNLQVFGSKTRDTLSRMNIAVVGCSGTGAPVIEQLNRLGVGELKLFDPDIVEHKNLNRITNTKTVDADTKKFKVLAIKETLNDIGLSTKISAFPRNILDPEAILEIAVCDFIFGCVDSAEARCLLNRISNYYLIPYIDIGISLDADGNGGVNNISGKVAYFQPGKSDHITRRSVLPVTLEAEALKRSSPKTYQERLDEGYIKGVIENSPAIIPVNTYASSLAVMEFLARVHNYRNEPNCNFAEQVFCLVNNFYEAKNESDFTIPLGTNKILGRGMTSLLLDMPDFSREGGI
ncbi:ThiF family adenylyltransferase [Shewanella baltica]|uniref:ThiF family adenylyltransferase n=1 Tax=Shewanella baltica TaxID=62322 RepID=UPI0021681D77|nr:ThiF family adenylyltransferase [Shewanella baltica]MCS6115938.1 ThiF family adenylyltransferase [Shewanella baltica]UVW62358.1 ThiF family adenylyltransferase [Shewanella baltica]